jgi:hypothetical protein
MSDLVEFLRAALKEDERVARAATAGPWHVGTVMSDIHTADVYNPYTSITSAYEEPCCAEEDAAHIARHDPARVLAEVAAKRQLLTICVAAMEADEIPEHATWSDYAAGAEVARDVLTVMAQPFAGRPGWREEWAG